MRESTLTAVAEFARRDEAPAIGAALLAARCLEEDLDVEALGERLRRLSSAFAPAGLRTTPWQFLRDAGFGTGEQVDVLPGSHIGVVMDTHSGLPITLGTLLIHVSLGAGIAAYGVNFPGHFLVRVNKTLVDPFSMSERSEGECLAMLPARNRPEQPFPAADGRAILLRMLNNIKYHHASAGEFHRALEIVECQLRALPGTATLELERGEYWFRLGAVDEARAAFLQAERLAGALEPRVAAAAAARLAALAGRQDIRH